MTLYVRWWFAMAIKWEVRLGFYSYIFMEIENHCEVEENRFSK